MLLLLLRPPPALAFLRANLGAGLDALSGAHPWHWYAWGGLPAALGVAALRQADAAHAAQAGPTRWFVALAERLAAPALRPPARPDSAGVAAAQARFLVRWSRLTRTLQGRRAVALLHAAAALVARLLAGV